MGQPGVPPQGMPPNAVMAPQGYNPAGGSTEGSPVHRMAAAADGYGNLQQVGDFFAWCRNSVSCVCQC